MLFYRLLSFLVPLVTACLVSLLFWQASLTYLVFIASGLISFFGTWWLIITKIKSKKEAFFYSLFSLLIIFSGLTIFLFIENIALKIGLSLITVLLFFLYLNELFNLYFKKPFSQTERLWLFYRLAQVFIIFLAASSLFGFRDFLSTPLILLLALFLILVILLTRYNDWQRWEITIKKLPFRILLAVIMVQLFWAVSLLPLVYYIKGILIAIFYSVLNESIIWYFERKYQSKLVRSYLIIVFILVALILVTAQWF